VKTAEAIEHFKTPLKTGRNSLADEMTRAGWPISPEAISMWGEHPPLGRQYQIESLTKGKLKTTPLEAQTKDDVQRPKAS
jgi:3-deoxy-7-phosphoheptulonate synthase|tara:strand:+ start:8058 stop:8297 length:240 start_codon:yes stop_codon:yes gene_type:complete